MDFSIYCGNILRPDLLNKNVDKLRKTINLTI